MEASRDRHLIKTAWGWSPLAAGLVNTLPLTMLVVLPWTNKERTLLSAMLSLYLGRETGATDSRDRIYTLLGLNTEADVKKLGISVDYTIIWQQLYESATRSMIKHLGLGILSLCTHPLGVEIENDLPSWIPDWTAHTPFPLGGMSANTIYGAGST